LFPPRDPSFAAQIQHCAVSLSANFRIGRWAEAEAEFRALVELAPTDEFAHYALGRALVSQGRRREATPHIKLARSLWPRTTGDGDSLD